MDEEGSVIPYDSIELIKKYLPKKEDLSVVDLGCAKGYFLFGLDEDSDLSFRLMEGVDLWNEIDKIPKKNDLNKEYINYNSCNDTRITNFISHQEDIQVFIANALNKYDLIILSNVLHFFSQEQIINILKQCQSLLKTDGIIYVKMANDKHTTYANLGDMTIFDEELNVKLERLFGLLPLKISDIQAEFIIK